MKTLILIVGPTAVGKTKFSIFLAQELGTEILSCDARQFYKELKIGTAMPSDVELETIPHHFIGQLNVHQAYTAGDFERDALQKIRSLFSKVDVVLMTGGSGLYEKAVTKGLNLFPQISPIVREEWITELKEKGLAFLQEKLKSQDPVYYQRVDLRNPQRLIRALAVIKAIGQPFSSFQKSMFRPRDFRLIKIGLILPREQIYRRIEQRVDQMMKMGLLQEAGECYTYRHLNALQTVGYKEIFRYIEGQCTLREAVDGIKKNTRRYAKRQLTWYRRDPTITWFYPENRGLILNFVRKGLKAQS
ncbi:MAG: tRNA (adenosine(37)-N6)-dimethylallyltransferase MiaA [Flavobacteriales bacterium AspAUS03]